MFRHPSKTKKLQKEQEALDKNRHMQTEIFCLWDAYTMRINGIVS